MRLSEFKDEKGMQVIGKILGILPRIAGDPRNKDAAGKGPVQFASSLLINSPAEAKELLAILADKDPSEYECDGATILVDIIELVSDPVFLQLFGLRGQTSASSVSASESSEADGTQKSSQTTRSKGSTATKKTKRIVPMSPTH